MAFSSLKKWGSSAQKAALKKAQEAAAAARKVGGSVSGAVSSRKKAVQDRLKKAKETVGKFAGSSQTAKLRRQLAVKRAGNTVKAAGRSIKAVAKNRLNKNVKPAVKKAAVKVAGSNTNLLRAQLKVQRAAKVAKAAGRSAVAVAKNRLNKNVKPAVKKAAVKVAGSNTNLLRAQLKAQRAGKVAKAAGRSAVAVAKKRGGQAAKATQKKASNTLATVSKQYRNLRAANKRRKMAQQYSKAKR